MALYRIIPTGDLDFQVNPKTGKKELVLVRDPVTYVKQKLFTRFRFFAGEWFRNANEGVPYRRDVFVKNPNLEILRSLFRRIIISVIDEVAINKFELLYDPTSRTLYFNFELGLKGNETLIVKPNDKTFVINFRSPT